MSLPVPSFIQFFSPRPAQDQKQSQAMCQTVLQFLQTTVLNLDCPSVHPAWSIFLLLSTVSRTRQQSSRQDQKILGALGKACAMTMLLLLRADGVNAAACETGKFKVAGNTCNECQPGTYSDGTGAISMPCAPYPAGARCRHWISLCNLNAACVICCARDFRVRARDFSRV